MNALKTLWIRYTVRGCHTVVYARPTGCPRAVPNSRPCNAQETMGEEFKSTHNRNCRSGVEGTCTHGLRTRYDSSGTVTLVCHKVLCIGCVPKVTGGGKFRLQEGSKKCSAGSQTWVWTQVWHSRSLYARRNTYLDIRFRVLSTNIPFRCFRIGCTNKY